MTIIDEGKLIRSEVAKLRPDKRRRYSPELKQRILEWAGRAVRGGTDEVECSKLLGIRTWRLKVWRELEARPEAGESLALVPLDVASTNSQITLIAPSGHRVEGLDFREIAALLREFA
jgi:hypothetical protein